MIKREARMNAVNPSPTMIVLAGINGAGKTTASRSLLAKTLKVMTFVNADVIAQGLSGFDPEAAAVRAGRIMLEQLHDLAAQRANFAFETTLAGRTYAGWLNSLRESGYEIHLFYFWLNSVEMAIARVAARVQKGGHHVPDATIRQRYDRSIRNLFDLYIPVVNSWKVYDNSVAASPQLIAEGVRGADEIIWAADIWTRIRSAGND
jgi:predicted ABC-type ATPase